MTYRRPGAPPCGGRHVDSSVTRRRQKPEEALAGFLTAAPFDFGRPARERTTLKAPGVAGGWG